jgi:hypothetical protein
MFEHTTAYSKQRSETYLLDVSEELFRLVQQLDDERVMREVLRAHDVSHERVARGQPRGLILGRRDAFRVKPLSEPFDGRPHLVVLLEDLGKTAVVHDGKVFHHQHVAVELDARGQQARPSVLVVRVGVVLSRICVG